jgi:protein-S-isoprenylcysteine O-methyltransferase Ste14
VVLVHWLQARSDQSVKVYVVWMGVGVVLSQTQAMALSLVTGNPLAHFIPGTGVLLLVVAGLLLRFKMAGNPQLQPT